VARMDARRDDEQGKGGRFRRAVWPSRAWRTVASFTTKDLGTCLSRKGQVPKNARSSA
jgi:hypothetical protein